MEFMAIYSSFSRINTFSCALYIDNEILFLTIYQLMVNLLKELKRSSIPFMKRFTCTQNILDWLTTTLFALTMYLALTGQHNRRELLTSRWTHLDCVEIIITDARLSAILKLMPYLSEENDVKSIYCLIKLHRVS